MQFNKTSKKPIKTSEISVAPAGEQKVEDSKPAKRTPVKRASAPSPAAAKSPVSKSSSHRHSKLTVPASPVIEEVVAKVVVAPAAPLHYEDIARLAYTFFEERNHVEGFAEEDWHRAVKTLSASASR